CARRGVYSIHWYFDVW
nr:immunoglobulin heavy chain junction region [Mus musculus]MBK4189656.1 immunoglobulin heavy chain junction region [Mus musculus]